MDGHRRERAGGDGAVSAGLSLRRRGRLYARARGVRTVSTGVLVRTVRTVRTASLVSLLITGAVSAQVGLPLGWTAADIGSPAVAGSAQYTSGAFTVAGAGVDVWDVTDEFQYVSRSVTGDVEITGRVVSLTNTDEWAKAGVMLRETLAANAVQTSLVVTPLHGTNFYQRLTTGDSTQPGAAGLATLPLWLRLTRVGSSVTAFTSPDAVTWTVVGAGTWATPSLYVGLEVTSHNPAAAATAIFDGVTVRQPVAPPPVVGGGIIEFESTGHAQPDLTGYQALLLPAAADPVSGTVLQVGAVVPKAAVAASPVPPVYRIPFTQAGVSVPACHVAQSMCPAYKIVLIAVGTPNNTARGIASTSPTFTAATTPGGLARPGTIRVR